MSIIIIVYEFNPLFRGLQNVTSKKRLFTSSRQLLYLSNFDDGGRRGNATAGSKIRPAPEARVNTSPMCVVWGIMTVSAPPTKTSSSTFAGFVRPAAVYITVCAPKQQNKHYTKGI